MTGFSQKYAIVSLLDDTDVDFEFDAKDWPQHVTLADVFAVDWAKVSSKIRDLALATDSFSTRVVGDDYFGIDKSVHVLLLEKVPEILELHANIIKVLDVANVEFNNPEFTKEGFGPHITVRDMTTLKNKSEVSINNIAVIDMFPGEDPYRRKLIQFTKLGDMRSGL